jgi:hypothetical protein
MKRNQSSLAFSPLTMNLPAGTGRDAFHCVPNCRPEDGDAMERVPTGFRGSMRELVRRMLSPLRGEGEATNVPGSRRNLSHIAALPFLESAPANAGSAPRLPLPPRRAPSPLNGERISRAQVRALNPRTGARLCRRPAAASGPALRLAFSRVALRFMGRAGVRGEPGNIAPLPTPAAPGPSTAAGLEMRERREPDGRAEQLVAERSSFCPTSRCLLRAPAARAACQEAAPVLDAFPCSIASD